MEYLNKLKKNDSPSEANLNILFNKNEFQIDSDYWEFIKMHDGAEGFLGVDDYVLLWNVEDLIALNPYYEFEPEGKKYLFFGSDGANLGYAFNKINNNVIAIDFLEIGVTEPKVIATSFKLFINKLIDKK